MSRKILKILILLLIVFFTSISPSFADVGDFETYDSGSSWSSSDSSWSSSDSSWGSSDRNSTGRKGIVTIFESLSFILLCVIFLPVIVAVFVPKRYSAKRAIDNLQKDGDSVYKNRVQYNMTRDKEIVELIKEKDELFNEEEFKSWASDLFIQLQYAWSDRDWEKMRMYETVELFERHAGQLNRYKQNGEINRLERVSVNSVNFLSFNQLGDKDYISIVLNSKMIDYIIDEKTENVLRGSKTLNKVNNYKLTFVRKTGLKTQPKNDKAKVVECPNCGAPTEITSAGKCLYCRTIIVTNEHDWVLSNLERYYGN